MKKLSVPQPSLSMCPDGGLLMLGSSVHRKTGYMYKQYRKLHGNNDSEDSICWFSPSAVMNPQLPASVIDRALAEDAPRAKAEYQNIWREDIADFIPADVVEAAIPDGTYAEGYPTLPGLGDYLRDNWLPTLAGNHLGLSFNVQNGVLAVNFAGAFDFQSALALIR